MAENKIQITIEAIDKAKGALTDLSNSLRGIGDQAKGAGGRLLVTTETVRLLYEPIKGQKEAGKFN
jgi:hypothetical protein